MRYVGRITDWNDEKGFGFVAPNGGGDRAFVHIKAFERVSRRLTSGVLISYELKKDERGRLRAEGIRFVAMHPKNTSPRRRAGMRKVVGASFLIVLLLCWLFSKVPPVVPLAYTLMSVFAMLLYAFDKSAAADSRWRTPENNLHFVAFLGGWPGALVAQDVFRHKSRKAEFQHVFWLTVVFNCGALAWLLVSGKAAAIDQAVFGP
jgi:uncharacterized membrane protein YsdA (DUF1294 family)/cold shock CspA family protein